MLKLVRQAVAPSIVHSRFGVGRPGTLIAIELAVQDILLLKPFHITTVVMQLRSLLKF